MIVAKEIGRMLMNPRTTLLRMRIIRRRVMIMARMIDWIWERRRESASFVVMTGYPVWSARIKSTGSDPAGASAAGTTARPSTKS